MEKLEIITSNINKINENEYFTKLKKKPILESFIKSQESFIDAVDNWSRALGLLLSRLPTDKERFVILQNLNDEHGNGDLNQSHVNTFRCLMNSLHQISSKKDNSQELKLYNQNFSSYTIVNIFNIKLNHYIMTQSWIFSVALIGMIEYTYLTVSHNMHQYLKNYFPEELINHYSLHETTDLKHYQDLLHLILPHWEFKKEEIINGFQEGYKIFNSLYQSLSPFLLF
jgi:Iron-containing redox enzyme